MRRELLFIGVLLVSGCSSISNEQTRDEKSAKDGKLVAESNRELANAENPVELGGDLLITGENEQGTIQCNERDVEFDKETTANVISFKGKCKSLKVDGVSNKIFVDEVGSIEVLGVSNKVFYGKGADGKNPKISTKGTSSEVKKFYKPKPKSASDTK